MGYRCFYAMPALADDAPVNRVKLEMYLRQSNAAYQLEAGVWDDVTETFVPVKRFNNSTTDVEYVECDFSEYNVYGKVVRTVVGANNYSPTQINVSNLASGMYFVRVTTEEGAVTKPFVKR